MSTFTIDRIYCKHEPRNITALRAFKRRRWFICLLALVSLDAFLIDWSMFNREMCLLRSIALGIPESFILNLKNFRSAFWSKSIYQQGRNPQNSTHTHFVADLFRKYKILMPPWSWWLGSFDSFGLVFSSSHRLICGSSR